MKKNYSLLFLLLPLFMFSQTTDLLISKYGEGTSNNKFLEIYNGTGADIDLSTYSLSSCSNGCDTADEFDYPDNVTFPAGTTIANGDVYVVTHGSADASIASDQTFTYLSNGNDAFALTLSGATASSYTIIDILGDLTEVNGSGWDVAGVSNGTKEHTLTRKTSVCSPNPTPLGSFGTDANDSEWIVTDQNSGWDTVGSYSGCITDIDLSILSPSNEYVFEGGTTTATITYAVSNFNVGATGDDGVDGHIHYYVNGGSEIMSYDTNPIDISIEDGSSYVLNMELVDETHQPLDPTVTSSVSFSVAYPCDLEIDYSNINTSCDSSTNGTDNYTVTIPFTGGGTSTYGMTISNASSIDGDDPSTSASGVIILYGEEGVGFSINILGDNSNSSCDTTIAINSPTCFPAVCSSVGDIIITEIFNNPVQVSDTFGEWFEVYNTTSSDIDMEGWEISDLDYDSHTISSSLIAPAGGYAILARGGDTSSSSADYNGGVNADYVWTNSEYILGNGGDEVIIYCGVDSSGDPLVIDQVIYDGGPEFPDTPGYSMQLYLDYYNNTDNDLGSSWTLATTTYGAGDYGTPGQNNASLSINSTNFSDFVVFPNPTELGFVNIKLNNNEDASYMIFNILGERVIGGQSILQPINIDHLQSGIYLIEVSKNNQSVVKKLVVN